MADIATPSAAEIGTIGAGADSKPAVSSKPERPDKDAFEAELAKKKQALDSATAQLKAKGEIMNAARPNNDPINERRKELRAELDAIKQKQSAGKASRSQVLDKVKALDNQLKARANELKNLKSGIPYKSAEEIDQTIAKLDKEVESGKMKVVDEKKALTEISNLRKQRKAFGGLDEKQKEIDKIKAQIAEVKGTQDKAGNKEEQDEFTRITSELDKLKSEQDDKYKALTGHREAYNAAKKHQDALYKDYKEFKDTYYAKRNAYRDYEREAAKARDERRKAEREANMKEKKQRLLNERLEDAKTDAYLDEIRASVALIRLLDPSASTTSTSKEPGKFAALPLRTVTDSGFEGMTVAKKNDEDYMAFSGGKKNKKGRGQAPSGAAVAPQPKADMGKFWGPGVLEQFKLVGLEPPASQDEVASVLQKVQEKKEFWQNDQKRKTQENIENAQKAFEAEFDANGASNGASPETKEADTAEA